MERIDVELRVDKARELFHQGYNCAQAVVLAYCDVFRIEEATAASISAPLGGGMGRLREVCGAVSGMFLIAGLLYRDTDPTDTAKRRTVYSAVQELAGKSKELNGSIICRELLALDHKSDGPVPEPRTAAYYRRRPCAEYVAQAARLVGEKINEESARL